MSRTAKDVMTRTVIVVSETAPYKEIVRLLAEHRVNALPVVNANGVLLGIVSEADLLLKEGFDDEEPRKFEGRRRRVERSKAQALLARDLMTRPVVTVSPEAFVGEIARLLHEKNVKQLPVVTPEGKIVGIVSRRDLLRIFLRTDEEIRREIIDEVVTRTLWMDRSDLQVEVSHGVVTLRGEVDDRSLACWLVELVGNVDGVVGVVDRVRYRVDDLAIRPKGMASHLAIFAPGARTMGDRR